MMRLVKQLIAFGIFVVVFLVGGCLPGQQNGGQGKQTITVYGFSIMKEALEKEIYPAFAAKWKQEKGVEINFVSSFAGSETVTNQILQGAPADIAILSIERDATRLSQGQAVTSDWRLSPNHGIVNKTPFVILVRKGNPKQIADFPDLAKNGVRVIHPDPVSSGGAQWSILAVYGSELVKSQAATGSQDANKALETLKAVWKNVISTPGSAREARTQFETGYGDALITYELEGLLMKQAGADVDVIIPKATIFSEHPAVVIDRNVTPEERPAVQAFLNYHFRSVTNESFNDANPEFAKIQQPFAIDLFGGWDRAYPEVIDQIFLKQVQNK